ncbi:Galactose oxidase central domain [Babesia microti strain RI]|uniref:Galactose oxidase central domain n=1 Tax=Babesia microti (strain RI) TaxID=1133968 RepID=I7J5H4_BABMR|nr:Galactose oxidase central domain [Babesia microti strain RI]CCF72882.1 Galactose oxidase central domain [Babesia microti strain RI]|eukprot:XP_012647491.1 Galactose oxidase central domain [Babesia microti strain RI]
MVEECASFSHNDDFTIDVTSSRSDDYHQLFQGEVNCSFRQINLCGGDNAPSPRAAHSATVVGNCILYFGGWSGNMALGDAYVYHTSLKKWCRVILVEDEITQKNSKKKSKNILARNNHAAEIVNTVKPEEKSEVYIHGGHDGTNWLSNMFCIDVKNLEYQARNADPSEFIKLNICAIEQHGKAPTKRACHSLTQAGGLIYAFGGFDGTICYNDLDVFTPNSSHWARLSKPHGKKPSARNAHIMLADSTEENLYLFGGHSGKSYYRDVYQYCISKHTWTLIDPNGDLPPSARGLAGSLLKNKFYIFGGFDGNIRNSDIYEFDPESKVWTFINQSNKMLTDRQRHSMVTVNNILYVFGGYDGVKWLCDLYGITCHRQSSNNTTNKSLQTLLSNLSRLVGSSLFSDVTICVDGKDIPAHKSILSASSSYFYNLFIVPDSPSKIQLHGWSYEASLNMIEYLYTAKINDFAAFSYYRLCELMGLADGIQLSSLKMLCQDELQEKINCENACYLLKCSSLYKADNLKNACFSYISEHSDQVMHTSSFEELSSVPALVLELAKFMNKK